MSDVTVVQISDVSKRFIIRKEKSLKERIVNFGRSNLHKEDFWALRNVDLDITAGSTVGLVGPNGSGKSTLLKLIGGILQPTSGTVHLRGRLAALLELGAGFHPDLTGRENVFLNAAILGLTRQETERHFDAIVDFSGIEPFIDTQVKFYSSGMYVRLAFAVAVHVDPDILLVDEVLAVGDEPFQRKCLERIRTFQTEGRTIILVSHSLNQVAEFCDRVVVLDAGSVAADGAPREALRVLRADFEARRQEEIERAQADDADRPKARFTGIAVRTEDGTTGNVTLAPGDGLTVAVEVEVEAETELTDWVIGVGITDTRGTSLFSTTTRLLDDPPPPLRGTGRYEFHLGSLPLADGEYIVQAMMSTLSGLEIHSVPDALHFTVAADPVSRGPLAIETSFHPLDAAASG